MGLVERVMSKYVRAEEAHKLRKQESLYRINAEEGEDDDDEEKLRGVRVSAGDIVLNPFIYSLDYKDHFDEQAQNQQLPEEQRQRLNSFLSTPKFIKCLTEISQQLGQMKDKTKAIKLQILKHELIQINQHLPASVYVPFVQSSIRNYCVLHIPPEEARVFQTKERAPVMLSIEVFRPDEMAIDLQRQKNKKKFFSRHKLHFDEFAEAHGDNPYLRLNSSNQSSNEGSDAEEPEDAPKPKKGKQLFKAQKKKFKEMI
mmetsp:Transcript_36913/g.56523  ORF Transcript_36913/g.56523 Transcript_36913/m.56523 type:complete len:257 (-) Transcript_36913:1603-2373(-)